jgi:CBS domain-containing protein/PAS domain-containing protein
MYSNRGEIPIEQAIIRQPLTITADATVADAIALMSAERQTCNLFCDIDSATTLQLDHAKNSCIIVTEDQKLIGILTEYDLIKLCGNSTQSVDPSENTPQNSIQNLLETSIAEVMTYPVRALLEWEFTDILVPLNRFNRYKIRHLPLVNDRNELVGLITHESLRQLLRPIDLLRLRIVGEVMTTDVVSAHPQTSAAQIAHLMSQHNVSSVVIVEQQGQKILPIGILTEGDIVQYLALGLDLMTTSAQTVMSFLPTQVRPEETLWTVREIMQTQMVNHLVITDQHGQMQGVISQGDLLKTLQPDEVYQLVSILETKISQLEQENIALLKSRNQLLEKQVAAVAEDICDRKRQDVLLAGQSQVLELLANDAELSDILTLLAKIAKSEAALRESEKQQQTLINALPDLVMRMSGDGIYLDFFPPDTFDVFDSADIIGKSIYDTTYPIDLARTRMEYIRKALETGESQIYEQELTINGHFHIEEVRISVCAENEVLIIVRDMSARTLAERALKQSEQKLSASESLLSAMFNQSPIGMVITDVNGQFIRTNP